MTQPTITRPTELTASWELALRAERKSPACGRSRSTEMASSDIWPRASVSSGTAAYVLVGGSTHPLIGYDRKIIADPWTTGLTYT